MSEPTHARTTIRAALKDLVEGVSRLSGRVVSHPAAIRDREDAPWCEIALGQETVRPHALGSRHQGRQLIRELPVSVAIHTVGKAEAIEFAESLVAELEHTVWRDRHLGGLLMGPLTLTGIRPYEPSTEGSSPRNTIEITWSCTYVTTEADPSTPIRTSGRAS